METVLTETEENAYLKKWSPLKQGIYKFDFSATFMLLLLSILVKRYNI